MRRPRVATGMTRKPEPMPPITLLIPCYNAGRFLPRLMGYVRELTVPFARVLCYDDGSTDDTVAIARRLGLEIVTPNPNRGVAHARNQLAARVETEWFHFHDADDRIAPEFVARLAPLCDDTCDVACCDADWVYEGFEQLTLRWRYDGEALACDAAAHLLTHPLGLNNSIIRRSAWTRVGGCDESLKMWEDADVHFRLALDGAEVAVVCLPALAHAELFVDLARLRVRSPLVLNPGQTGGALHARAVFGAQGAAQPPTAANGADPGGGVGRIGGAAGDPWRRHPDEPGAAGAGLAAPMPRRDRPRHGPGLRLARAPRLNLGPACGIHPRSLNLCGG